ncbi:histidine phosphatase family protein [Salinisphaera sp. T31B1]|uniref:histidine phosphatase family protein n=1 Tax=Salinisphaera sp. T31B1 TaxID=727963 RepID=UPI0033429014
MVAGTPALAADDTALWHRLASGEAIALMRHASAPGTGDPAGFVLDDCATQRTLSAAGRTEARAIGQRFREHGIARASVYSSQWCRCLETARLLGLGPVRPLPALNSFFEDRDKGRARTAAIEQRLAEADTGVQILVTHQVNITALTGVFPASGEIVVVRPDSHGLAVIGRIAPP